MEIGLEQTNWKERMMKDQKYTSRKIIIDLKYKCVRRSPKQEYNGNFRQYEMTKRTNNQTYFWMLEYRLECHFSIAESLGSSSGVTPNASFWRMQTLAGSIQWLSYVGPLHYMEDSNWLLLGPVLAVADTGTRNLEMENLSSFFSLFLCFSKA